MAIISGSIRLPAGRETSAGSRKACFASIEMYSVIRSVRPPGLMQKFGWLLRQASHCPQKVYGLIATRSPGLSSAGETRLPTASMIPEPSCPKTPFLG